MNSSFYYREFELFESSALQSVPPSHAPEGEPHFDWEIRKKGSGALRNRSTALYVPQAPQRLLVQTASSTASEYNLQNALTAETRDFIRAWVPQPEFYGTLTYKFEVREAQANRYFRSFLRGVAKLYSVHVNVAWAEEYQRRGAFHHHFLLGPIRPEATETLLPVAVTDLQRLWKHGMSDIREFETATYDSGHGAAFYLAKHEQWDLNTACPRHRACRRKKGCLVAPSSW